MAETTDTVPNALKLAIGMFPKAEVEARLTAELIEAAKIEAEIREIDIPATPAGQRAMEEMFEMWTSASLGFHHKPVVLYDPIGFYRPLLDWVRGLAEAGLVKPEALARLVVCDDLEAALDACGGRR